MNIFKPLLLFTCLFFLPTSSPAASLHLLGDLPGGHFFSNAISISADGQTIAGHSDPANMQMVRWSPTSTTPDPLYSNYYPVFGQVSSISADGSTIVGFSFGSTFSAARWTATDGLQILSNNQIDSSSTAVSSNGSVVVGNYTPAPDAGTRAFRWTSSTGLQTLDLSPYPVISSTASAISADGQTIVGQVATTSTNSVPYLWTPAGTTLLPIPSGVVTTITPDASIVAGYFGNSFSGRLPFLWTPSQGVYMIPIPTTLTDLSPVAISDDGSVLIGHAGLSDSQDSWLWTPTNGLRSIRQILQADGIDTSPYTTIILNDLSSDGQSLVGYLTGPSIPGGGEAFIATIPEPSLLLFFLTLPLLPLRHKNRPHHPNHGQRATPHQI